MTHIASTKFCLHSPLELKVRELTILILPSIHIQRKTLFINKLQPTNNKTKRKTSKSSTSLIFSTLFSVSQKLLLNAFNAVDPPQKSSVDSRLGGNFAAVEELEPKDCDVIKGELPLTLNGVYIRNGPNLQHQRPRHLLDLFFGHGMLHSMQLSNGHARYC